METNKLKYDLVGHVHVRGEHKRPLCKQAGMNLALVSAEAFKKIPAMKQCGRCRRALGIELYPGQLRIPLSENQRRIVKAISARSETPGQWIPVAELCENKTSSGWSSLHRSIRRLQACGNIEKKTVKAKAFVRLKKRNLTPG
jgi:hypothetical protein